MSTHLIVVFATAKGVANRGLEDGEKRTRDLNSSCCYLEKKKSFFFSQSQVQSG
jgi:hypothetical protein